MIIRRELESLGLLMGMIIGAGMFTLPYIVHQSGIFWGVVYMVFAAVVMFFMHTIYGEAIYVLGGKHRLPGYIRKCFGSHAGQFATFTQLFGFFGSLLAYGILAGIFFDHLIGDIAILEMAAQALGSSPQAIYTLLFFFISSLLLLFNIEGVGRINLFLMIPFVCFIIILAARAFSYVNINNFHFADHNNWFLPYGAFLFSFGGAAAIPEVVEMLGRKQGRVFEWIMFLGLLIPAMVYGLFIVSVLGVSGSSVTPDGISALAPFLGSIVTRLGAIIGLLAVSTSFLALGLDLRNMLHYDFEFGLSRSWLIVISVPVLLFLFGASDIISIISLVGGVMVGIDGFLILLLALHVRKYRRHPEGFIHIGVLLPYILLVIFGLGMIWQITSQLIAS